MLCQWLMQLFETQSTLIVDGDPAAGLTQEMDIEQIALSDTLAPLSKHYIPPAEQQEKIDWETSGCVAPVSAHHELITLGVVDAKTSAHALETLSYAITRQLRHHGLMIIDNPPHALFPYIASTPAWGEVCHLCVVAPNTTLPVLEGQPILNVNPSVVVNHPVDVPDENFHDALNTWLDTHSLRLVGRLPYQGDENSGIPQELADILARLNLPFSVL